MQKQFSQKFLQKDIIKTIAFQGIFVHSIMLVNRELFYSFEFNFVLYSFFHRTTKIPKITFRKLHEFVYNNLNVTTSLVHLFICGSLSRNYSILRILRCYFWLTAHSLTLLKGSIGTI